MQIPYSVDVRPDTGLYNAKLGIWLFLASEAMLFGGMFSAYALLRTGAVTWPGQSLSVPLGAINTAILIGSSMTMVMAWASLKLDDWRAHSRYMLITVALGLLFLVVKGLEYREHWLAGERPSHDTFFALYYTLTGLHAVHMIGGMAVLAYFVGPGRRLWRDNKAQYTNRVEAAGLYWHFVDLMWTFLFPVLYLL